MSGSEFITIPGKITVRASDFQRLERSPWTEKMYMYYTKTARCTFGSYPEEDCIRLTDDEAASVELQLRAPRGDAKGDE